MFRSGNLIVAHHLAAYFVLKATLDGAAGENPLGSIVAALFLMSLSATMQLFQGWNKLRIESMTMVPRLEMLKTLVAELEREAARTAA
jgi:hypothetical protein